jgi:hypothetical protein
MPLTYHGGERKMSDEMTPRQIEIVKLYTAGVTGDDDPEARLPEATPAAIEAGMAAVMRALPDANPLEIRAALRRSAKRDSAQADLMQRVLVEAQRRGLKPGQPVLGVFEAGEVDRLFPGFSRIIPPVMRRAPPHDRR